ncbi:glutathione synthetase ATP-binding domain-like protein [Myriangium duriaei CBS 260.36]|uniref:Glutathione synthetase ATP-binding domain-like protein n=1 Tax=Myriangium duriaei CBS 260.36 TaxID=1168546 RepID=A0A9P4MJP6_9PEZI|nr:glutathione synthetase ATP-binding domain-like protein [Myriangium duriaei CBS 260.36]
MALDDHNFITNGITNGSTKHHNLMPRSHTTIVRSSSSGALFDVEWSIRKLSHLLLVADIRIQQAFGVNHDDGERLCDSNSAEWIRHMCGASPTTPHHFKLLMPTESGYSSSSRLLEQRLAGTDHVSHVKTFLAAKDYYCALTTDSAANPGLDAVLKLAAGAVKVEADTHQWACASSAVDADIAARLNLSWILPQPVPQQRVALIRGRMVETSGRPVYDAVASLGINLVVIDEATHWARPATKSNIAIRESFIVTDMTEDEGLVDRLVSCIQNHSHPIDGVFTCSDNYFVAVAEVAERLGFPTAPSAAYKVTVDKHLSRSVLQDIPGQIARVSNFAELQTLMDATTYDPVFPVIVKPVKGWSSECVARVDNMSELATAIEHAVNRHSDKGHCVIEPYFEGPEVDANFVMLNGKILFSEIGDEPPREGDHLSHASFSDVTTTSPSALPKHEQEIIARTIRNMLLKLHMKTGVFHAEARLSGSCCQYGPVDGVTDLIHPSQGSVLPIATPTCRLIEINARPPGFSSSLSTLHCYGVNYFQLHTLAAVGDDVRLKALSKPFDFSSRHPDHPLPRQAQAWVKLMHISAPTGCGTGGILKTRGGAGPIADLLHERPEVNSVVYLAHDEVKEGDRIDEFTAGGRTCVGHIGVRSKIGRTAVTALGDSVRDMLEIDIV